MKLHIDIETYSGADLTKTGAYRYVEDEDFTILMAAYAINGSKVQITEDCTELLELLIDPAIEKHAFNAQFERICLEKFLGISLPIEQWHCVRIHAQMAGYPGSLLDVGSAMGLTKLKSKEGTALINYFSKPCKPTKVNGGRTRNLAEHAPDKWQAFKGYCVQDVIAEMEIHKKLCGMYTIPPKEREMYIIDQQINDRGVGLEPGLVRNAIECSELNSAKLTDRAKAITYLENPNSPAQIKGWIEIHEGFKVPSLSKELLPELEKKAKLKETKELLKIRSELSKTSVKKYTAMQNCICSDNRARGLLQYYGANRTGRWAGRLVQVQNLPKNQMPPPDLDFARQCVLSGDYQALDMVFHSTSFTLSELVRTAFVPKSDHIFAISDFSAIEARVIAWLANEKWRLEVFNTHGKIYEASAAQMFKVPIESIDKGSPLRQKGKIAELALGYQGSVGALKVMGGEKMGLTEEEMQTLVDQWRIANPNIKQLWYRVNDRAMEAVVDRTVTKLSGNPNVSITFAYDNGHLFIELPSGRKLSYLNAQIAKGSTFGQDVITYQGVDQTSKRWTKIETYGGKLVENIVQAIARDCLAEAMLQLNEQGYDIVMHVHDEVVIEVPIEQAETALEKINSVMSLPIPWAKNLPLKGDGFITTYYRKD